MWTLQTYFCYINLISCSLEMVNQEMLIFRFLNLNVLSPADKTLRKHHKTHWCFSADGLSRPRFSEEHTGLMRRTWTSSRRLCVCVCVCPAGGSVLDLQLSCCSSSLLCSDRKRNSLCGSSRWPLNAHWNRRMNIITWAYGRVRVEC